MRMALTGDGDFGFAVLKLGLEPSYNGIPSKEDGYEDDHQADTLDNGRMHLARRRDDNTGNEGGCCHDSEGDCDPRLGC